MDFTRVGLFYTIAVLLIIPVDIFIAYVILRRDHRDRRNQLFFTFAIAMVIFVITNYLADAVTKNEALTWILRVYFLSTTIMTSAIYFFSFVFPSPRKVPHVWYWLLGGYTVVASLASLTPLIVHNAVAKQHTAAINGGPLFNPYNMLNLVILIIFLVTLTIFTLKSQGQSRRQMFSLSVGFFIFFLANLVVNIVLVAPDGTAPHARFGTYAAALFLASTTYAITTQHLFDIRVFISRAIIYSLLVSFSMALYGIVVNVITTALHLNSALQGIVIIAFITAAALSFAFEPFQLWVAEKTDSWLFKKEYQQQEVTKKLGEKLANAIGLDEALDAIMQTLSEVLHLNHAATYVFQTGDLGKQVVKRTCQIGYSNPSSLALSESDFIVDYFTSHSDLVLLPAFQGAYEAEEAVIEGKQAPAKYFTAEELRDHAIRKVIIEKLKELDASVIIPLQMQLSKEKES